MKKTLLLLLTLICSVMTWADEVTFTFKTDTDITYTATGTSGGGATCTVSKSNVILDGSNAYTDAGKTLSVYTKSTLTITAPGDITQIDLEYNGKVYPFDEAVGDGKKGEKFAASGAHPASYTPATPAESITLSNPNGGKTELLSLKVTYTAGTIVNVTGVSLDKTSASLMVGEKLNLVATVAPANATNKLVTWSSSDETVATVVGGLVSAKKAGETTITAKTADGNFTATCKVAVTAKTAPVGSAFFESFDAFNGAGGNDGAWGGINTTTALGTFDNEGWTTEGMVLSGAQCASIRKSTADTGGTDISSGLTTPAIGKAGDGHITFNAQSWTNDTGAFYIDLVNGGTFEAKDGVTLSNNGTTAKVTLTKKANWDEFDLSFTGLTADSKFRFYMASAKRGFLDEVAVFVTPTFASLDDLIAAEQSFDDVNVTINDVIFAAAADPERGIYGIALNDNNRVFLSALGEDQGWDAGGRVTGTLKHVKWQYMGPGVVVGSLVCPPTVWDDLEYSAPQIPTFSSIEEMLDANLPSSTAVNVTINGTVKKARYEESQEGLNYYAVQLEGDIILGSYVNHDYGWEVGGTISGTLEKVTYYDEVDEETGERERGLMSMTKDIFAGLAYVAPTTATITLNAACTDGEFVYGTYSNKKAFVVPEDIIVYEVAVIDGCIMKKAYSTNAIVPANTGVLVAALEGGDFTVSLSNEEGESVLGEDNALRASGAGLVAEEMEEAGDNYYYRLTMQNGTKVGFWWGAADGAAFNIAANKAYLVAPKTEGQAAKGFALGDTTTLINAINASEKANGVAYNLAGQRVNANHKGIVIINGHKFINK